MKPNISTALLYFIFILLILILVNIVTIYIVYNFILIESNISGDRLLKIGYILELSSLMFISLILLFFTRRIVFTLILTAILYLLFIYVNLEKINFLQVPVFPSDVNQIKELIYAWDVFKTYIPILIITSCFLILTCYLFMKIEKVSISINKLKFPLLFLVLISIFLIQFQKHDIKNYLIKQHGVTFGRSHTISSSERFGLLFDFFRQIVFMKTMKQPKGYSKEKIDSVFEKNDKFSRNTSNEKISLIIYFIESFTDPSQIPLELTEDPIPVFHNLQKFHESGYVYSPVVGGRSANAEFELLTGFSMQFFPESSIPYNDIPTKKLPSIAQELGNLGYYSSAIHVADLGFFNYVQMYKKLGFNQSRTLWNKVGVSMDPAGRFPSDSELVNEIIEVSEQKAPFFIFAFPNSTHGKWDYNAYENSSINIANDTQIIFESGKKEIKTYLNALNTADKAIGKLVNYFSKSNNKVAILIMGDHQPGFPEYREQQALRLFDKDFVKNIKSRKELKRAIRAFDQNNPMEAYDLMHLVPYVIWTNYKPKINERYNYQNGMNSLILKLFDVVNVSPKSKFYHFLLNYSASTSYKSLLNYVINQFKITDLEFDQWHQNYKLLQYDILFGEKHFDN